VADDAGALLVRSGLVSSSALEEARSQVTRHGGTLGEHLVAAAAISDEQLTEFYRQRLLVPQVNPNTLARLSQKVIAAIPSDMAIELRAIPVSLDGDNNLTVAMSDPSDRHAVDEISFFTGTYVVRAVATQMQIAWCLAHYYGHITVLGARLIQPQQAATEPAAAPPPPAQGHAATADVTGGPTAQMQAVAEPAAEAEAEAPATTAAAVARAKVITGKINATRHHAIAPVTGPIDEKRPLSDALDEAVLEAKRLDEKVTETMTAVMPATEPLEPGAHEPPPPVLSESEPSEYEDAPAPSEPEPDEPDPPPIEIEVLDPEESVRPTRLRPRGISSELGGPVRPRAASIRPPVPIPHLDDDEDDEPMISIEEDAAAAADRAAHAALSRRQVKTGPPELKARAGEVSLDKRPDRYVDDQPRIIIEDDALVPVGPVAGELRASTHPDPEPELPTSSIEIDDTSVMVDPSLDTVSDEISAEPDEPVLLEQRRPSGLQSALDAAVAAAGPIEDGLDTLEEEVVVLEARKPTLTPAPAPAPTPAPAPAATPRPASPSRPGKTTQTGIGANSAAKRSRRATSQPPELFDATARDMAALSRMFDGDDELSNDQGRALWRDDERTGQTLAAPPAERGGATNPRITAQRGAVTAPRAAVPAPAPTRATTSPPAAPAPAASAPATPGDPLTDMPAPVILRPRAPGDRTKSVPPGAAERTKTAPPGAAERTKTAPPQPPAAASNAATQAAHDDDDELAAGPATSVMTAVELDAAIPQRRAEVVPGHLERRVRSATEPDDDSWSPAGAAIRPALLGAVPGSADDADADGAGDKSRIPLLIASVAPLISSPPAPPETSRSAPVLVGASGPGLVRALKDATSRSVDLIRSLERAKDRDAVISLLIAHLAESHRRAGFFAFRPSAESKAGELAVFKIIPAPAAAPVETLRLDRPSTLQDVVGTRLPYRGPVLDEASRTFLDAVLGACPPEILLVPVSVRERIVGILFGEHRLRHTFDDQLALAARGAGMALERILLAKRG